VEQRELHGLGKEAFAMIFTETDASCFEEDARLTAMWLWTLKTNEEGTSEKGEGEEEDDEAGAKKGGKGGFVLEYDSARKIAQGLGAHLEDLASLVAVEGETVRLLPVSERARPLFRKDEGKEVGKGKENQMDLFAAADESVHEGVSLSGEDSPLSIMNSNFSTLDRVHQSMILFAAGHSEAMKRFLVEDGAGKDTCFWTLAQALSALYPATTDEKRWVDGVLARKKGLGF
jgi:hypothetical protein